MFIKECIRKFFRIDRSGFVCHHGAGLLLIIVAALWGHFVLLCIIGQHDTFEVRLPANSYKK
jgi:hypothetical protein